MTIHEFYVHAVHYENGVIEGVRVNAIQDGTVFAQDLEHPRSQVLSNMEKMGRRYYTARVEGGKLRRGARVVPDEQHPGFITTEGNGLHDDDLSKLPRY